MMDVEYLEIAKLVANTKCVNDNAERALGMATDYHCNKITTDETQRQYLFKVVKELRERMGGDQTKKNLKKMKWL